MMLFCWTVNREMSLRKGSDGEVLIRGARFPEFCLFSMPATSSQQTPDGLIVKVWRSGLCTTFDSKRNFIKG